jgi:hypothetical protein
MNDVRIANWLNENGHQAPEVTDLRITMFIQSQKRRRRLDILETELSLSISNLSGVFDWVVKPI